MVDANSYLCNWRKHSLNFKHYDISHAAFYNLMMKAYPNNHTSKTFAKGRFVEPFMELYSILGKGGEDLDIGISTDNYVEGTCLLPFDVTLTSAGKTGGNCRMELQFCNPIHKIT